MNIAHILVQAGKAFDKQPAVAFADNIRVDYQTLAMRSATIANHLLEKFTLAHGDRVAIIAKNCPEYVELYFAIWHAGLVVVPINAKLHQNDFRYILAHSGTKLCFCSTDLMATISPLSNEIPTLKTTIEIGKADYLSLYQGEPIAIAPRNPNDAAWLFYTSGTTGKPKGALQSHKNLQTMTLNYFSDVDEIACGDGVIHAAPMSHGSGYYILPHVVKGGINIIPASGGFDEPELLNLINHYQGITFFAAPTMVKRFVEYYHHQYKNCGPSDRLNHLKTIIYGGGPMYQQDLATAQKVLGNKLVQIYGQGECPMTICALSKFHHQYSQHPEYKKRLASIGLPMLGIDIKLVDCENNEVANGETGEVLVRGDAVMLGYFNNDVATNETIINGWLKTGDMAIKHQDGFICLVDRSKDVIISGGTNIYPREIEEVLNQHPAILESSVIGKPDATWGEVVIAVVVLKPLATADATILDTYCLEQMARFKRPKQYVFAQSLPKNNTGKILKTVLREMYCPSLKDVKHG